jgi:hypothetical protein
VPACGQACTPQAKRRNGKNIFIEKGYGASALPIILLNSLLFSPFGAFAGAGMDACWAGAWYNNTRGAPRHKLVTTETALQKLKKIFEVITGNNEPY